MFIWTTRTILVFGKKIAVIWKHVTKKRRLGKNHFLRLSGKWINSSGVSSQKPSYVYEAPAGAFISAKLTFLEFSDMPSLEKVCISSDLGILQMTPTATCRQFFHLARAPSHSVQGWNIPFGNPSLRFRSRFARSHVVAMKAVKSLVTSLPSASVSST